MQQLLMVAPIITQSHPLRAATLGPKGTSSHIVLESISKYLEIDEIDLCSSFEEAAESVKQGNAGLFLVPHAYSKVNTFYMDPTLNLFSVFVHDTPMYGIAARKGEVIDLTSNLSIALHEATIPLLNHKLDAKNFYLNVVSSTSQAAYDVRAGQVDLALTTSSAVKEYGLVFIEEFSPIRMSWSLFRLDRSACKCQ